MKMINYAVLIAACLGLTACDEYDGLLNVQQPVSFKMKKTELNLAPGSYQTEVSGSSDKIKVKITVNGAEQKVEFKLPKKANINNFNDVDLAPEVSGQAYRIKGAEKTDFTQSESTRTTESCTYYTTENRCGYETTPRVCNDRVICNNVGILEQLGGPHGEGPPRGGNGSGQGGGGLVPGRPGGGGSGGGLVPGPGGGGGSSCRTVTQCYGGESVYLCRDYSISHFGTKEVEFYTSYTTTNRKIEVIEPATAAVLAVFGNTTSNSQRNYTYQGQCF